MKNYSDETFVPKLRSIKFLDFSNHTCVNVAFRSIKFLDYSNHTCVNDAFQDFVTKFLSAADLFYQLKF